MSGNHGQTDACPAQLKVKLGSTMKKNDQVARTRRIRERLGTLSALDMPDSLSEPRK